MILVSTGTILLPFSRLIKNMVEYTSISNQKVIIQSGSSNISQKKENLYIQPFFSTTEMVDLFKQADRIVTAGGEGTVLQVLQFSSYQPILFPRLKKYQEHVNDQQLEIAQEINQRKLGKYAVNKQQLFELLQEKPIKNKNTVSYSVNTVLIEKLNQLTDH